MAKGERDTINGYLHISGRRTGNTTRQIDTAIRNLFDGYKIIVHDHSRYRDMDEFLFHAILKRLEYEHKIKSKDMLIIDKIHLTLELTPKYYGKT